MSGNLWLVGLIYIFVVHRTENHDLAVYVVHRREYIVMICVGPCLFLTPTVDTRISTIKCELNSASPT